MHALNAWCIYPLSSVYSLIQNPLLKLSSYTLLNSLLLRDPEIRFTATNCWIWAFSGWVSWSYIIYFNNMYVLNRYMVGHIRCLPNYLYLPKYLPTQLKLIIMCGVSSILSTNVLESALPVYLSFFSLPLPLALSLSSDILYICPFPPPLPPSSELCLYSACTCHIYISVCR